MGQEQTYETCVCKGCKVYRKEKGIPDPEIVHTESSEITYHIIDEDCRYLPEDNECVVWWFSGEGCPPYIGSMCDDDWPGLHYFFCWSNLPEPPIDFFNEHNPE